MANENNNLGMFKGLLVWGLIFLLLVLLFSLLNSQKVVENDIRFSEFLEKVENGEVIEVTISDNDIIGRTSERTFHTYAPNYPGLVDELKDKGVAISVKPPAGSPWYEMFFYSWGPIIFLVLIWVFFMRQMQGGGNKAMSFGKSKARLISEDQVNVTFADVAGIEEAKEEVQEIIDFLRDPQKFMKLGATIPKGVLLVGAPGTGKTLLGRAIAGEAEVPFYSISGSDFVEMFVGVGASRVRDLFEQARKNAPCIVFIDEIDAVGRHRGAGLGGGHDEREQTLNQLLVEMDGFEGKEGVILLAATNRPDVLDPALLRPGRFDRQVVVPPPDVKGREAIINVHIGKVPQGDDINVHTLAKGTPGFSGADLANLVNEAALLAARKDKSKVDMADFEEAKDKVMMGAARHSMIISDEEKKNTAYHEAGHALVGLLTPGTDPVHKVTIIPRGRAMGLTWYMPEGDKYTHSRDYLKKQLMTLMGGRVAEELAIGEITTGAGNDIERATDIARKMVTAWGMSDKIGPLTFGKKDEQIFLGREMAQHKDYSEKVAEDIDDEIRRFVTEAHDKAKKLVKDNYDMLDKLALALLEQETMDSREIRDLLGLPQIEEKKSSIVKPADKDKSDTEQKPADDNAASAEDNASAEASADEPDKT